jgi:hypothetical protein
MEMNTIRTPVRTPALGACMVMLALLCEGCASKGINADIASWQGSHLEEVSSAWGAPNECIEQGDQTVCSWGGPADPDVASRASRPRAGCVKMLAVDESGLVTGWRWRGSRCPETVTVARTP